MSIENKLNYLSETKNKIRNAIISKGGAIDNDTTFREYADIINNLPTGGDSEWTPDPEWIDIESIVKADTSSKPQKYIGLFVWDGVSRTIEFQATSPIAEAEAANGLLSKSSSIYTLSVTDDIIHEDSKGNKYFYVIFRSNVSSPTSTTNSMGTLEVRNSAAYLIYAIWGINVSSSSHTPTGIVYNNKTIQGFKILEGFKLKCTSGNYTNLGSLCDSLKFLDYSGIELSSYISGSTFSSQSTKNRLPDVRVALPATTNQNQVTTTNYPNVNCITLLPNNSEGKTSITVTTMLTAAIYSLQKIQADGDVRFLFNPNTSTTINPSLEVLEPEIVFDGSKASNDASWSITSVSLKKCKIKLSGLNDGYSATITLNFSQELDADSYEYFANKTQTVFTPVTLNFLDNTKVILKSKYKHVIETLISKGYVINGIESINNNSNNSGHENGGGNQYVDDDNLDDSW